MRCTVSKGGVWGVWAGLGFLGWLWVSGPVWAGLGWSGLVWAGLGRSGPVWAGLGWSWVFGMVVGFWAGLLTKRQ